MTSEGHNKRYKNTFDGLNTIVRTQGWRQLFAGLSINYIKVKMKIRYKVFNFNESKQSQSGFQFFFKICDLLLICFCLLDCSIGGDWIHGL